MFFQKGLMQILKTRFSLCFSVAKRNKGFTLGLIILFTILTTIIIMARFTVPSVRKTTNDYISEYRVPDIWALTEPLPVRAEELLPEFPEITGHEYGIVMDVRCRVKEKQVFALSLVSIEEDGFLKYSLAEEQHTDSGIPEIMLSTYYARANDIHPGDIVELETAEGYQDFYVSALVFCPVNMFCLRDSTSWCDSADFGYLYLPRSVMDEYFPTAGYMNFWAFRVAEDCPDAREKDILEQISDAFGTKLLSSDRFSASTIRKQLDSEMDQAETIIGYAPLFSYVLGIFFTCLFIQQIMQDQKKTIGLLRALGYSCNQVLKVFLLYTVLTCIIGMLFGIGLGAYLTKFCIRIYQERYSLPFIHYFTDIPSLILFLLLPMVIGIISCVTRSGIITRMDPAEAYGGAAPAESADPPLWLHKIRVSEMNKIALLSVYRNKRRFLLSAVSIASSIILSLWSIALIISNNAAQPAAFGDSRGNIGRFQYDALISFTDGYDFPEQVEKEEGISLAEPVIVFMEELHTENQSLQLQINALGQDSRLIVPKDADGNSLQPGDGILLEEIAAKQLGVKVGDEVRIGNTSLKVTGIAREIVNSIQYISYDTAEQLGYHVPNKVAVSFAPGTDEEEKLAALSELPGFSFSVISEHQSQSLKSSCRAVDAGAYIMAALAFSLGLIIVYNMIVLSVEEKKLDYATLIALGTSVKGFISMAFTENILRYLAALIPGIPAGCLVSSYIFNLMSSLNASYPFLKIGMVCGITALISLAYLVGGVLFTLWKIKSVDPSVALNARE